jgi:hypothetical protein
MSCSVSYFTLVWIVLCAAGTVLKVSSLMIHTASGTLPVPPMHGIDEADPANVVVWPHFCNQFTRNTLDFAGLQRYRFWNAVSVRASGLMLSLLRQCRGLSLQIAQV